MKYIVYRMIYNSNMLIKVGVVKYTDELNSELQKEEIGTNILEIEDNFDDAMTSTRVYSRAYRELFYRNYDVQIIVENE